MRATLIALAFIALPAAAAPPKAASPTAEFEAATRDAMKDPESVRFRNLRMTEGPKLDMRFKALCGEVNAKNGHGGYTGFSRFVTYRVAKLRLQDGCRGRGAGHRVVPVHLGRVLRREVATPA